jgi:hypothetical protein
VEYPPKFAGVVEVVSQGVREVKQALGEAVSPGVGAGPGASCTAPSKWEYDIKFEKELEERAKSLSGGMVHKIVEVALEVAEPYNTTFDKIDWTKTVAITRQDGIADFIYVCGKVVRLPWRWILPLLLKDYPQVVFLDMMKVVRREKVVETLRRKLKEIENELTRLAKRKSRHASGMKALYEEELNNITKALSYLEVG